MPKKYNPSLVKQARLNASSYVSYSGKLMPAKSMLGSCRCQRNCYKHISSTERQQLFDELYSLPSYEEQNKFLELFIHIQPPSRKKCLRRYIVNNVRICKVAFCNIFCISRTKVDMVCLKASTGEMFDKRGKESFKKSKPEVIEAIRWHFYNWQILEEGMRIQTMFKTLDQSDVVPSITYEMYKSIFKSEFCDLNKAERREKILDGFEKFAYIEGSFAEVIAVFKQRNQLEFSNYNIGARIKREKSITDVEMETEPSVDWSQGEQNHKKKKKGRVKREKSITDVEMEREPSVDWSHGEQNHKKKKKGRVKREKSITDVEMETEPSVDWSQGEQNHKMKKEGRVKREKSITDVEMETEPSVDWSQGEQNHKKKKEKIKKKKKGRVELQVEVDASLVMADCEEIFIRLNGKLYRLQEVSTPK